MPEVSLTTFVDFVSKAGTPKVTIVKNWKNQPPYDPAADFYKALRERIAEVHKKVHKKSSLDRFLASILDKKKLINYTSAIAGYKKWWGKKTLAWRAPLFSTWSRGNVEVRVNPELRLTINGVEHVIKLYFKSDPLAKSRVDAITHLMHISLGPKAPQATMGVLDIRRAKLITPTVPIPGLTALLQGEAASWEIMYASV